MTNRYEPPEDFHRKTGVPAKHFKHSAIASGEKELWLLRVPDNISLKQLEGLKIKHPKASLDGILAETTASSSGSTSAYQIVSSEVTDGGLAEFKGMAEMNILLPDDDDDGDDDDD
ncbi:hypothetical protein GGI21_006641, partial [Coemansia aciculifera]